MTGVLLHEDTVGAYPCLPKGDGEDGINFIFLGPPAIQQRRNAGSVFLYDSTGTQINAVVSAAPVTMPESVKADWIRVVAARCALVKQDRSEAVQSACIRGLKRYLDMCVSRGFLTADVRAAAWRIWNKLNSALTRNLEVPDACPGSNGEILFTWDRGDDHFEIEIERDLTTTFFYLNTKLKNSWEITNTPDDTIDERVKQSLELFRLPGSTIQTTSWEPGSWVRYRP